MTRSVLYTSSPLLASKTPLWRSKMIVAMLALGFVGLGARAAYVQVFGNDFFQRQGEVRFARTLELPANRGRILDRNGLLLASSVVAPSIWAIPEDVERNDPAVRAKLRQTGVLLASKGLVVYWTLRLRRAISQPSAARWRASIRLGASMRSAAVPGSAESPCRPGARTA